VEMEIRQATVTVSVNGPPHDWDPRNCSWGPRTIYVLSLVNAYVNISWAQITFLGARITSAGQRRGHLHRAAHRPLALPARPRLRRGPVVRPPARASARGGVPGRWVARAGTRAGFTRPADQVRPGGRDYQQF
jgi:hypothetical protein